MKISMLLRSLVRSTSVLRHPLSQAFHSSTALQVPAVSTASLLSKSATLQPDDSHVLTLLEHSIAQRRSTQALSLLAKLESPPGPQILQKLVVLIARQKKNRRDVLRAFEILRGVYRAPGLKPDDYTKLASIYVMDACLRFRLLDAAMELYDEAVNQAVVLDLPAYDGLLTALLEAKRLEEATEILSEVIHGEDVCPPEQMLLPVLLELIRSRDYGNAMDIMKKAMDRRVAFSSDTFHPLLTQAEKDTESTDLLVNFLTFVEDSWEECKGIDDYDLDEDDENMDDSNDRFP